VQVINDNILDKDTIGEATRHNGMYVKSKLIELLAYRSEEELDRIVEYLAEDLYYYKDENENFIFLDQNGNEIQSAYVGRYTGSQAWNKMVDNNEKINRDIHTLTEKISRAASNRSRDNWTLDLVFLAICALVGFIVVVYYGAEGIMELIKHIGV
jgi:hypothetical protein